MTSHIGGASTDGKYSHPYPLEKRPTEMLVRQMQANRNAARYRNPENGKRHHAHVDLFRPYFVRELLAMRAELRRRNVYSYCANDH